MAGICAGCRQEILDRRFLKCSKCLQSYDLVCANVSDQRFYNTLKEEHKKSWKCQLCRSKEPKTDNKNTPVRLYHNTEDFGTLFNQQTSTVDQNVTIRKKVPRYTEDNSTISDENVTISPHKNTPISETQQSQTIKDTILSLDKNHEQVTVQKLTTILQQNNEHILSALRTSFRNEMEKTVSEIMAILNKSLDKITGDQLKFKEDLSNLNSKIIQLDKKCRTIQTENENLVRKIQYLQSNVHLTTNESQDKLLILHGLAENYWETEAEVIDRIINIFYDLLNVNLSGYIEEVTFIGRKNNRRPLKIELNSKRIKKYILENSMYLKEAGFSITEYLSPQALRERRNLSQALHKARQNGHHAVVRNNKLFINGREVTDTIQNDVTTNTCEQTKQRNEDTILVEQPPTNHQPPRSSCLHSNQSTNTNRAVASKASTFNTTGNSNSNFFRN